MFRRFRHLTDFELGLTLYRAHKTVEHLRGCQTCRRQLGYRARLKARVTLWACCREANRRGIDVEIVPTSSPEQLARIAALLNPVSPRSVYETPISVN